MTLLKQNTDLRHEMTNKIKIETPVKAEITIVRPNGETETVNPPGTKKLNDKLFARIAIATKAAGRGKCIAYRNLTEEKWVDGPTDAEMEADKHHKELKSAYRNDAYSDYDNLSQTDRTPSHKTDY